MKNFVIKLVSLLLIVGCFLFYQSIASERAEAVAANEAKITEVERYNREIEKQLTSVPDERGGLKDGIYTGSATGYGGAIAVSVHIENGAIASIDVTEHSGEDPAYFSLAEAVLTMIREQQSTDVDTVSGATFSSIGLINAVKEAVHDAEQ